MVRVFSIFLVFLLSVFGTLGAYHYHGEGNAAISADSHAACVQCELAHSLSAFIPSGAGVQLEQIDVYHERSLLTLVVFTKDINLLPQLRAPPQHTFC